MSDTHNAHSTILTTLSSSTLGFSFFDSLGDFRGRFKSERVTRLIGSDFRFWGVLDVSFKDFDVSFTDLDASFDDLGASFDDFGGSFASFDDLGTSLDDFDPSFTDLDASFDASFADLDSASEEGFRRV